MKLAKIIHLSQDELFAQKPREKLSQHEVSGDNYLFWCYITLRKPVFRKKYHPFECTRTFRRFIFGQLTVCQGQLFCDAREIDFFYWAKVASQKKWFDLEDVRDVHISYYQDQYGKIESQMLLERNTGREIDPGIK